MCMYIVYIHMYMQYIYTVVLKTKRVFYASTSAYWAWGYYLLYIPPWIYNIIHDTHKYCHSHTESLELIWQRPVRSSDLTASN